MFENGDLKIKFPLRQIWTICAEAVTKVSGRGVPVLAALGVTRMSLPSDLVGSVSCVSGPQ